ncbi:hypothetical protein [Promicromonospora sp. NPDC057488]|uniref:hypothetical protein n=1 Tax=Promicromonospora sp. NPDC057488 TaxID=3346147 RepID=UPI0036704B84
MADTCVTLDVRAYVADLQRGDEARLRARIEQAVQEGDLTTADAAVVAEHVQTLWHGLSARAELGASRDELRDGARFALTLLDQTYPTRLGDENLRREGSPGDRGQGERHS